MRRNRPRHGRMQPPAAACIPLRRHCKLQARAERSRALYRVCVPLASSEACRSSAGRCRHENPRTCRGVQSTSLGLPGVVIRTPRQPKYSPTQATGVEAGPQPTLTAQAHSGPFLLNTTAQQAIARLGLLQIALQGPPMAAFHPAPPTAANLHGARDTGPHPAPPKCRPISMRAARKRT